MQPQLEKSSPEPSWRPKKAAPTTSGTLGFLLLLERAVHMRETESNSHCLHLAIPCMSGGVSGQVTPGSSLLHLEVVPESRNRGVEEEGRRRSCCKPVTVLNAPSTRFPDRFNQYPHIKSLGKKENFQCCFFLETIVFPIERSFERNGHLNQ